MSAPDGAGPLRLVLASANPDKVKEIVAVLSAALPVELLPRPDGVPDVRGGRRHAGRATPA